MDKIKQLFYVLWASVLVLLRKPAGPYYVHRCTCGAEEWIDEIEAKVTKC